MATTCIRCGYERQAADQAPEGECPKCGVIYARAEQQQAAAARMQQQAQLVSVLRRQQARDVNQRSVGSLLSFRWLIVPTLVQISFAITVVGIAFAFVGAIMQGKGWIAAAALVSLVIARIFHEAVIIVFRIAEDISEMRTLMGEEAVNALRHRSSNTHQ